MPDNVHIETFNGSLRDKCLKLHWFMDLSGASSKTTRHRLNSDSDQAANSALHIIAIGRLRTDPRTKAYMAKRVAQRRSKFETIRCLKRYIAREVFTLIGQRQKEINQARITT